MGWLFRKSVKVAPGVRANVSGTGLYHRSYSSYSKLETEKERRADRVRGASAREKEGFKRHPFLMVLSAICCAMVPLSIIIPPIPWWVMFPCGIVGVYLYCKACG